MDSMHMKGGENSPGPILKGAKNYGCVVKGGGKHFRLVLFFGLIKFNVFWCFNGFCGNFNFQLKKGRGKQNIRTGRKGEGEKCWIVNIF